jgi:uroporphyrinogen decarboxylase
MNAYTSKDRIVAALKGQYADRVPATVMFGVYASKLAGFALPQFFTDAEKHARAHAQACEIFHPDTITIAGDVFLEAETFGAKVEFPEDSAPHLKTSVLENRADLGKLNIPDPKKINRLCWYLEACERSKSEIKDIPVSGASSGPWTLAGNLRGLERLILDTVDDPDFVHQLMRFTTAWIKIWVATVRDTGIGIGMGEASASCSVISPKVYRTFIKPYHEEIFNYFKERKLYISLHICGYIDPIMEDVLSTGVSMISIDSPSSLDKLVELSQGKAVIMGNVPTALFAEGTQREMEAAVKQCIDTAAKGSKYILCSGCEIPLTSRKENINYFMEAASKHGYYK